MESEKLKQFLTVNGLKQTQVADYLGISRGHMSNSLKGEYSLGAKQISKLIQNNMGWDASMFLPRIKQPQHLNDQTNPEIIRLIKIIEEQNHTIAILAEQIAKQ